MCILESVARDVYTELGPGHSESVYHRAFEVYLRDLLIPYETERILPIVFRGRTIGNFRCDLIVDHETIVELKSISKLRPQEHQQINNYMKLLEGHKGILINFGPTQLEFVRFGDTFPKGTTEGCNSQGILSSD